jgi:3-phosphoglycerate kinase
MLKSIKDVNVSGKVVLCRVDYNVPIKDGKVLDDTRIKRSLPTLKHLLTQGAKIILTSHLGRPKGVERTYTLQPIAQHLSQLINEQVQFVNETVGPKVATAINELNFENNRILLLENTRFHIGETKNDPQFAKDLSKSADIFVSDAFGTVHRSHASTVGVTNYLPGCAGVLVEEEYMKISSVVDNPSQPSLAIIGGAKVSTKLGVLKRLIDVMDTIIIGGGMAFTFLKAKDLEVGKSLIEEDMVPTAKELLDYAERRGIPIILPVDVRLAISLDEPKLIAGMPEEVDVNKIPKVLMGLDVGKRSQDIFSAQISKANTILWNGPMGVFENDLYKEGTIVMAQAVLDRNTQTVIGGGDTIFALNMASDSTLPSSIHVSTGGGASLELIAGIELPGLVCLTGKIRGN